MAADARFDAFFFQYWGKARPDDGAAAFHLLAFHSLDVAVVGRAYLRRSGVLLTRAAGLLRCSEDALLSWMTFMLALHDLGKFSAAFQAQRPDLVKELQGREAHATMASERHDTLGFLLWNDLVADDDGILPALGLAETGRVKRAMKSWLGAVTGHHGMPPNSFGHVRTYFRPADIEAAREFVLALAHLLLTDEARRIPACSGDDFETFSAMLSWWMAGVTVLADWIGSNSDLFLYQADAIPLEHYWDAARDIAETALDKSGVLPVTVEQGKTLAQFFPHIKTPSPLQHWAATTPVDKTPRIYLLEDVTGAGKTEAAVMLAYRLMAQGAASGFFIGLPTMATANAMYRRLAGVYGQLFAGDANLTLAHGFKSLVAEFANSILPPDAAENDPAQADDTASARCTAWLADHGKRALLAAASVGTVDQVLLSVLHSKHQSLRLLGLYHKVLLVDEVHACDDYMQKVLETVLAFHARTGGSAILLSATLPGKMKQSLLDAYAVGRNQAGAPAVRSGDYPLATCWRDGDALLEEEKLASRPNVSRTVALRYEADLETVYAEVLAALAQGKCVAWIRNTVADAMAAYAHLSRRWDAGKITLFHARFAMADRLRREAEVLRDFGEKSEAVQRAGRLMIATQVAEQSLDFDADLLITDLAPIDRVLQRAGRLHRHVRDAEGNRLREDGAKDQRPPPCLWIYGPAWTAQPTREWYGAVFPGGQYVYADHGQLWLSATVLRAASFTVPLEARRLIETVFSGQEPIPEALQKSSADAEGEGSAKTSMAQQNTLKFSGGYVRGEIDWWEDASTPSRLGEETRAVMLARWVDGRLLRWADDDWPFSMVKVSAAQLDQALAPAGDSALARYEALKLTLPSQGKWCALLALTRVPGDEDVWQGQAMTLADPKRERAPRMRTWLYDDRFGLRLAQPDTAADASD